MSKLTITRRFFAGFALIAGGCATPSQEPRNLDLLKDEIRAYVESGQYEREIARVAERARAWFEERAPRGGGRLTVVFDLDETLFSNWPHMKSLGLGYTSASWRAWVAEGKAPAIAPVRDVYRVARRLGLEVVFITGRRERDRAGTEKNLRAIDCADYVALICKPDESTETSQAYKTAARAKLAAEGRVIIANIGDQESDLAGGFAERTFKLPAPFYISR